MPTVNHHIRKMMRYTTLGADEKLKRVPHQRVDHCHHHIGTVLKTLVTRGGIAMGARPGRVAMFAGLHTFVKYARPGSDSEREP